MTDTADVAIIGGGVIGCAIAFELSDAGLDVVVLERGEIAGEASSAAAGLLVPLHALDEGRRTPLFDLYLKSSQCFPELVESLENQTGMSLNYNPSGSIRVAVGEDERIRLKTEYEVWNQVEELSLEWVDQNDLRTLEPNLSSAISCGVLSHDEKSIDPALLTRAFARAAQNRGCEIRTGCPVESIRQRNGTPKAVVTQDGEISVGSIVIAAGAWSRAPCQWFGLDVPIGPARGQMLSVRPNSHSLTRSIFSFAGGIYPRLDGTVFIGSNVEHVGFDRNTTPEGLSTLSDMIPRLVPSLHRAPVDRFWAGLRPECRDGVPVIGNLPGCESVIVAAGHFKMGITGSPITAKMVRKLVVDRQCDPLIETFDPARFAA